MVTKRAPCIFLKWWIVSSILSLLFYFLTEIPVGKQWRPWSDTTSCGVWSGSALFAHDLLRVLDKNGLTDSHNSSWTYARRPVPRLWIRSAEVRRNVVRRMGTQQHIPLIFISLLRSTCSCPSMICPGQYTTCGFVSMISSRCNLPMVSYVRNSRNLLTQSVINYSSLSAPNNVFLWYCQTYLF